MYDTAEKYAGNHLLYAYAVAATRSRNRLIGEFDCGEATHAICCGAEGGGRPALIPIATNSAIWRDVLAR
jgi:hypothetical protein